MIGAILTILAIRYGKICEPYREQEIAFSVRDSFCEQDQELELSTLLESEIYYTDDGSLPSRESKRYEKPIHLTASEDVNAVTIRAIAYYGGEDYSDICTKTYFLGKKVLEKFSSIIVAISGNPDDFFGFDRGILVPGRLRETYIEEHPDEPFSDRMPANYYLRGDEAERPVHVELFNPDGTCVVSQDMGIRVHGGFTRSSDMKSLRLIARNEYGDNRVRYNLFPEEGEEDTDVYKKSEYKKILLRNHGNDEEVAYLRNELVQQLAEDSGLLDTQEFRAASVYINGEYYGFEWMEEVYDRTYFETHYGTNDKDGTWQVVMPNLGNAEPDSEDEAGLQAAQDFDAMYAYRYKDLTNDETFAELQKLLDVENFLQYCAIEVYVANPDWPGNNCKAYRWYSNKDKYREPYTDGRWRFLLYDLDMGMARVENSLAEDSSIGKILGIVSDPWDRQEPLLQALLKREDMQKQFVEILETMMEGPFSSTYACEVIDDIQEEMKVELEMNIQRLAEKYAKQQPDIYADAEEAFCHQLALHEQEINTVKEFFRQRPQYIQKELRELLNDFYEYRFWIDASASHKQK